MDRKALQGFKISFKDPDTEEIMTGFFFGKALTTPEKFEKLRKKDTPLASLIEDFQVTRVQDLPDMAAIEEFKEFVEGLSEMIEDVER